MIPVSVLPFIIKLHVEYDAAVKMPWKALQVVLELHYST